MGRGDSGSTPPNFTTVQNMISNPADPNSGVIDRTAPFTTTSTPFATFGMGNNNAVSLEPNIHLDHLSDYIGHLDELRRKSLERLFRARRVDIVPLSTTEDYLLPLRAFFEQRERRLAA